MEAASRYKYLVTVRSIVAVLTVLKSRPRAALALAFGMVAMCAAVPSALALLRGDAPPTWTWEEGVPGRPIKADDLVRGIAGLSAGSTSPVDIDTLREVVSAGRGLRRYTLVAARGLDGRVCLGARGQAVVQSFYCLTASGPAAYPFAPNPALLPQVRYGGARARSVDYATLVGVARADVTRVVVRLANGSARELPLNRWRGFGYAAESREELPVTVIAYTVKRQLLGSDEIVLESVELERADVSVSPLCGGAAGPCPPGVP